MIDEALQKYRDVGWALLPGVADTSTLDALRERTRALMAGEIVREGLFFQLDGHMAAGWEGPSERYRKIEKLERDPLFRAWIDNPVFERIARAVIEGPIVTYRAMVMSKPPSGTVLPWHQDAGPFWGVDRDPELQIWTALDDAPMEAGCLEVVPGSHRDGLVGYGGLVDDVVARERNAEARAVTVPARAGDVVLIHNYLWHRSGSNRTDKLRRAFSVCYMSAATRCIRRKRAPRMFPAAFRS